MNVSIRVAQSSTDKIYPVIIVPKPGPHDVLPSPFHAVPYLRVTKVAVVRGVVPVVGVSIKRTDDAYGPSTTRLLRRVLHEVVEATIIISAPARGGCNPLSLEQLRTPPHTSEVAWSKLATTTSFNDVRLSCAALSRFAMQLHKSRVWVQSELRA